MKDRELTDRELETVHAGKNGGNGGRAPRRRNAPTMRSLRGSAPRTSGAKTSRGGQCST